MTESVVQVARHYRAQAKAVHTDIVISCTGGRGQDFIAWLGHDLHIEPQITGDLGMRLQHSFTNAFERGAHAVLVVGADVPAISAETLHDAFDRLTPTTTDVVIGPAVDGGYYLLGLKQPAAPLFCNIAWGTADVYCQTIIQIEQQNLCWQALPTLNDTDLAGDLTPLREDPRFAEIFSPPSTISVIIPTLNEATAICTTLSALRQSNFHEIIVVDGGSHDATAALATQHGATVLHVSGGRAAQLNAGAAVATSRILLFLHADTTLPATACQQIRQALNDPATVAGAFRFQTNSRRIALRALTVLVNWRARLLQFPYGDQGIFLEKRVFDELGGYPPIPVMEDFELVRRLRQRGKIALLTSAAVTSARRWQTLGVLRTTLINQLMIVGYLWGVKPEKLRDFYRRHKSPNRRQV